MTAPKGVFIYANLVDSNNDGIIDMISFLDPAGRGIALAVDRLSNSKMDQIHVFQDVTGDGMLDAEDKKLIEKEAHIIFDRDDLEEGQIEVFIEEGAYG